MDDPAPMRLDRRALAEYRQIAHRWRTNPEHRNYARTCGGTKTHRPDCWIIRTNVEVSDALINGKTDHEAGGNVPHPTWVDGDHPTCKICGGDHT